MARLWSVLLSYVYLISKQQTLLRETFHEIFYYEKKIILKSSLFINRNFEILLIKMSTVDDVNTFKRYMDLNWNIGERRGYPIQISKNGSLTNSGKEKLNVFANFSTHAVILMCQEDHVQPIVNMVYLTIF